MREADAGFCQLLGGGEHWLSAPDHGYRGTPRCVNRDAPCSTIAPSSIACSLCAIVAWIGSGDFEAVMTMPLLCCFRAKRSFA